MSAGVVIDQVAEEWKVKCAHAVLRPPSAAALWLSLTLSASHFASWLLHSLCGDCAWPHVALQRLQKQPTAQFSHFAEREHVIKETPAVPKIHKWNYPGRSPLAFFLGQIIFFFCRKLIFRVLLYWCGVAGPRGVAFLGNRGEKIWRFLLFVCGAFLPIETCRRQASEGRVLRWGGLVFEAASASGASLFKWQWALELSSADKARLGATTMTLSKTVSSEKKTSRTWVRVVKMNKLAHTSVVTHHDQWWISRLGRVNAIFHWTNNLPLFAKIEKMITLQ
jgi:hypothetical protein